MSDLPIRNSKAKAKCTSFAHGANGGTAQATGSNDTARPSSGWIGVLMDAAQGAESEGFAIPERHAPRSFHLE